MNYRSVDFKKGIVLALWIMLIFSFSFHAMQVEHMHYGDGTHHQGVPDAPDMYLSEYMHLTDKKYLLQIVVPIAVLFSVLYGGALLSLLIECLRRSCTNRTLYRERAYILWCLRRGIMHAKSF